MKFIVSIPFSVLLCGLLMAQDPFTLSVDVDMVLFNVSVTDSKGRLVSGLTPNRFEVFEDGREQVIHSFQMEDSPATVGLVIDNSGSMTRKRAAVITAASTFLRASNPDDEIFIVNFNERTWLGLPAPVRFTNDKQVLETALDRTRAIGRTALYDAVARGLSHLEEGTRQRKALVVLSDGGDNASRLDAKEMIRLIQSSTATIYAIGIYDVFAKDKNPGVVKDIARAGGGESYFPSNLSDLPDIWVRIANGIRGQYTLGYFSTNPSHDGKFRNVKITATDKDGRALKVRTREGYVLPSAAGR
jgi:VWFA-related protein